MQIGLGTSVASQNLLKLNYDYGTNDNNGNVLSQTITVPLVGTNQGFTAVQSYSYDSLNRLKSAVENVTPHGGSASQSWKHTFTFDRHGNRRFDFANPNTTFPDPNCPEAICNPTISTANNRLTSTGWQYDAAGNTTADPQGRTFTYDGENKQAAATNASGATLGTYYFDGDGKRVKKVVPNGETTIFVYDAGAKLVAEYSTVVAPVQDAKVAYLTADHLGSPRINTDASGEVTARHDYYPFGEELYTAQRTQGLGYTADSVRQQFTSYERDNESNLDFAQARMFAYNHGRFTSPDPYNIIFEKEDAEKEKEGKGQKLFNDYISQPQNWNRYVYVWNNPLRNIDPDGEKVYVVLYTTGNSAGDDEFRRAAETQAENIKRDGRFDPKKDTVLVVGVKTKADAQAAFDKAAGMEKDYGKVQQVQIFSHADKDGPVFHNAQTGKGEQWTSSEVSNLRINWDSGGEGYFFGCNTAAFAQTFANAQNVTAYGYDRFAYFSSSPDGRVGPNSTGPLYLIAADGWANSIWGGLSKTL
ncbi:MAG: hypothetical protein AB1477_08610 [Acidobacteriota bacterium]